MSNPQQLRYSKEHEWLSALEDGVATIGITEYAANALGDVVYAQLPEVGDTVTAGETCGELESTKSVSDLYSPVTGEVTAANQDVVDDPSLVNSAPFEGGWLFKVRVAEVSRSALRRRVHRVLRQLRPLRDPLMSLLNSSLHELDPDVAAAVDAELHRQQSTLEMIASENFAPVAVMEAQGSVLTNKYAEGYPGRRYYGGCEHVDVVEQIAIDRIKALFGAEAANVQPHSGAQANAAAMFALLKPGDTIMGLNLAHGGHLTHGMKINFSGKLYNVVPYHVDETGVVDMEEVERLAKESQPKLIVA